MSAGTRAHGDPPVSLHEFRNDDQWAWACARAAGRISNSHGFSPGTDGGLAGRFGQS